MIADSSLCSKARHYILFACFIFCFLPHFIYIYIYIYIFYNKRNLFANNFIFNDFSVYACYHSVQSLLSSRLLSRNVKVKIYKTIILPVVLNGCETWSLTLRVDHRLRVFENRILRRISGPKRTM
jgi:hypothetical protein